MKNFLKAMLLVFIGIMLLCFAEPFGWLYFACVAIGCLFPVLKLLVANPLIILFIGAVLGAFICFPLILILPWILLSVVYILYIISTFFYGIGVFLYFG